MSENTKNDPDCAVYEPISPALAEFDAQLAEIHVIWAEMWIKALFGAR
jgi:hypothetical protein